MGLRSLSVPKAKTEKYSLQNLGLQTKFLILGATEYRTGQPAAFMRRPAHREHVVAKVKVLPSAIVLGSHKLNEVAP